MRRHDQHHVNSVSRGPGLASTNKGARPRLAWLVSVIKSLVSPTVRWSCLGNIGLEKV